MLNWMVLQWELDVYFETARVQPSTSAFGFLLRHREEAGEYSGPKMDQILRREYDPELAEKLVGKGETDKILDEPTLLHVKDDPTSLDAGYILFSSSIDWDAGSLKCDWIPDERDIREMWFPNEELLYSEFEGADYEAEFTGLKFDFSRIEMLLPSMATDTLKADKLYTKRQSQRTGRPPKWDWEGALAFITAEAQTPDGLPTGHGAQAKVETLMAGWFERETGASPSISQLRQRASRVMRLIEKD